MGIGIFSMHYIGMFALHESAIMIHAPLYVIASLVIAIVTSELALWLASEPEIRLPLVLSAVAFEAPALSIDLLASVVAVVAFLLSGIFLLFLVPDRAAPGRAAAFVTVPAVVSSTDGSLQTSGTALGRGTYAPLGGAGAPPTRLARHLPIQREGATQFIAVDEVVAVHANAHYTYVFNGAAKLFCPLSIGEVESRLDRGKFIRVHRSHIINIERVVGYRRSGDNETVEMAASGHYSVPVSRSRVGLLKTRIGTKLE
jgi:hypothetical protein